MLFAELWLLQFVLDEQVLAALASVEMFLLTLCGVAAAKLDQSGQEHSCTLA